MQAFGYALQERDIVCYIATMFGTEIERYDGYNLAMMDPGNGCDISNATWNAMKAEAVRYNAVNKFESYILVRSDYTNCLAKTVRSLSLTRFS